jgi:hypothetical protein
MPPDLYEQVKYWAKSNECTITDYLVDAIEGAIKRENSDYDLPTLETARLNQLIDYIASLSSNIQSLEDVVISGFDSLSRMTTGDNYLLDADGGEIHE